MLHLHVSSTQSTQKRYQTLFVLVRKLLRVNQEEIPQHSAAPVFSLPSGLGDLSCSYMMGPAVPRGPLAQRKRLPLATCERATITAVSRGVE